MAQITSGVRRVLSHPAVYDAFQLFMGGNSTRNDFARDSIRVRPGDNVLDIGCGTAEIRAFLPEVNYWGFDISEAYIEAARKRYGAQGNFVCKLLDYSDLETLPKFDVVLGCGLLHHLDSDAANHLFQLAKTALKPGGRLVTIDPCYAKGQNPISRLLVSYDRGQNVLTDEGYVKLASSVFSDVTGRVRHQAWIPYTHWIMECRAT
ncbi:MULTISPECIES: class I SAM-dependent methyltransferase [Cupriavidus]|jgi:SAM-dependent methyltransferase|uniref:Class I SAM-dependent methyltransferase n=1 Tax=Cupriavidus pauculus TaxID=82633 RepID=A0A5P2H2U9_9BURK|nr:class I SAM-dependent methyltransferase [Cupriavidus pauculus]QET02048.1 class I SAM-dependent methyltransferase [Cupriavidus pauculus]